MFSLLEASLLHRTACSQELKMPFSWGSQLGCAVTYLSLSTHVTKHLFHVFLWRMIKTVQKGLSKVICTEWTHKLREPCFAVSVPVSGVFSLHRKRPFCLYNSWPRERKPRCLGDVILCPDSGRFYLSALPVSMCRICPGLAASWVSRKIP